MLSHTRADPIPKFTTGENSIGSRTLVNSSSSTVPRATFGRHQYFAGPGKLNPQKAKLTDSDEGGKMPAQPSTTLILLPTSGDHCGDGTAFRKYLRHNLRCWTVLSETSMEGVRKTGGRVPSPPLGSLLRRQHPHRQLHPANGLTAPRAISFKVHASGCTSGWRARAESIEEKVNSSFEMQVETFDASGLSFINSSPEDDEEA